MLEIFEKFCLKFAQFEKGRSPILCVGPPACFIVSTAPIIESLYSEDLKEPFHSLSTLTKMYFCPSLELFMVALDHEWYF